jgi:hypothetical protein
MRDESRAQAHELEVALAGSEQPVCSICVMPLRR